MNGGKLGERAAMGVRNAPLAPCVERLRRLPEVRPNDVSADTLDQRVMGMKFRSHASLYQHSVYISRPQSLIGQIDALMHKFAMSRDPAFGARLKRLIPLAGFKNPRRFAIDGMGWDADSGPQRLTNYLKGRIPDVETTVTMADKLRVTVSELLGIDPTNSPTDEELRGILQHLLSLEGIPPEKADTIANASLEAQRLLRAFPDEEPLQTRAKYAARAAWIQRRAPAPGT